MPNIAIPLGSELVVATTTSERQDDSTVATLASGGFVVIWARLTPPPVLRGQLFDAFGEKVGDEFEVGQTSSPSNLVVIKTDVTALSSGGFLVRWTEDTSSTAPVMKMRVFDSDGNALGATITADEIYDNAVALPTGGFVATWAEGTTMMARIFDSAAAPTGTAFQFNTSTTISVNDFQPAVVQLANGDLLFTWSSQIGNSFTNIEVRAQRTDVSGTLIGSEFIVNDLVASRDDVRSTVTALSEGGFVVTWIRTNTPDPNFVTGTLMAQVFDAAGDKVGTAFEVPAVAHHVEHQSVTALPNGGFLVVWEVENGTAMSGNLRGRVHAQAFDASGARLGDQFEVSPPSGLPSVPSGYGNWLPDVATLPGGNVVITWRSNLPSKNDEIHAQVYSLGLDPNTIVFGPGEETVTVPAIQGPGARYYYFEFEDRLIFDERYVRIEDLSITPQSGGRTQMQFSSGSGIEDFSLVGDFSDGDFMLAHVAVGTQLTYEFFLPTLTESARLAQDLVNGVANAEYLHGDNGSSFEVTLLPSVAGYDNALGVYEVTVGGGLVDVRIIAANVKTSPTTILIEDIDAGNRLGFFIIQNGANTVSSTVLASSNLGLEDVNGTVVLTDNGSTVAGAVVFLSHDANLNPDNADHVVSGVAGDGSGRLQLGFEDLLRNGVVSDDDFQDVVFQVGVLDPLPAPAPAPLAGVGRAAFVGASGHGGIGTDPGIIADGPALEQGHCWP